MRECGGAIPTKSLPILLLISFFIFGVQVPRTLAVEPESTSKIQFFETNIRPVLAEKCFSCHSSRAEKLKAGLRLDSRVAILRGGDSGPAMVAGKPDESLLMEAIRYESFEMPPRGKLSDREIKNFETWIEDGAVWQALKTEANSIAENGSAEEFDDEAKSQEFDWRSRKASHWSWQPIAEYTPPELQDDRWSRGAIDKFVLAKLRDRALRPAASADRLTLIRRLYFDLIGLPPTVEEVQTFVENRSEDAYEQLVEQLLRSPHFGEKWARHWLDLVRYAETRGHEFDYAIEHAHEYRDYLIRALNADVPYDVLLREHLAGDLLQPPRLHPTEHFNESILGTTFWHFEEGYHGATDVVQYRADQADNRLDVLCKSFLALSVACARCHDHKFDPISTEDYYGLAGIVRGVRETNVELCAPQQLQTYLKQLHDVQTQVQNELKSALRRPPSDDVVQRMSSLIPQKIDSHANEFQLRSSYTDFGLNAARAEASKSSRDLANVSQKKPSPPTGSLVAATNWSCSGSAFGEVSGRIDPLDASNASVAQAYVDGSGVKPAGVVSTRVLDPQLTGVLRSPTFAMPDGDVFVLVRCQDVSIQLVVEEYRMARHNPVLFEGSILRGDESDTHGEYRWLRLKHGLHAGRETYLEFVDDGDGYFEVAQVRFYEPDDSHPLLNRWPSEQPEMVADEQPRKPAVALARWQSATTAFAKGHATTVQQQLVDHVLAMESFQPVFSENLLQLRSQVLASRPTVRRATVSTDGVAAEIKVSIRGNHLRQGELVPRRLPVAMSGGHQPPVTGTGRVALADRLLNEKNPFTARVAVNRLWHHLFGRGIVPTVDDFGFMGQPPTHPRLLDWLAVDLRQHDWSLKHSIRQMVLSSTYRMSSLPNPANAKIDATNELLHAMRVRRLSAEAIRDQLLAIAGNLSEEIEGESIEVHFTDFMNGRGRPTQGGPIDGAGRRSVYLKVRRNFLSPLLTAFDLPTPTGTRGRRNVSNVPSQALAMMNDPFVVMQAKRWSERLIREESNVNARLDRLVWEAYGRAPTAGELNGMRKFLAEQKLEFVDDEDPEQAAWQDLCHTMFNSKELIFIR